MAVELHHAWMWDCPECGRENFERAITQVMTKADAEKEAVFLELEGEEAEELKEGLMQGAFYLEPDTVTCKHCNKTHKVETEEDEAE
jgi:hypothetical protein